MDNTFWCLTTFFNPVGYKSRIANYHVFAENLAKQNVNLLTIELAFGKDYFYLRPSHNIIQLRSKSILWQKERMLNYGLSTLPPECKYIAWIDGDILFEDDNWANLLVKKLQTADVVQPFQEVKHLLPHEKSYSGQELDKERSILFQYKNTYDWLNLRKIYKLPYATVGFAWAAKRSIFSECGMYDKHVLGSNDNLIIDSCLNCFGLHHYWNNINQKSRDDMNEWIQKFGIGVHEVDYLPLTIYHLFHGAKKYRGYIGRETIIKNHDYDPKTDIKLENNVYEWNSNKPDLHTDCRNYFYNRREDDDVMPADPHTRL